MQAEILGIGTVCTCQAEITYLLANICFLFVYLFTLGPEAAPLVVICGRCDLADKLPSQTLAAEGISDFSVLAGLGTAARQQLGACGKVVKRNLILNPSLLVMGLTERCS